MHKILIAALLFTTLFSCKEKNKLNVSSPDGKINVELMYIDQQPHYTVSFDGQTIIKPSKMHLDLEEVNLNDGYEIISSETNSFDETWEMPWGEKRIVKNNYNKLSVKLHPVNSNLQEFNIVFRVYDDGLGFRYEFPEQANLQKLIVENENTEFNLTGNHTCWWIPGDWDIYEHLYTESKFTEIDALAKRGHDALAQTYIPVNAVNTPVTMKTNEGIYLSFHEADLTNYPGMTLEIDKEKRSMKSGLVGSENRKAKAVVNLPFNTPWRTIQISESAGGLIESDLITNLNDANTIGDVSWFKPMKYIGIWWDMHLGRRTWDKASGNHGATTEYAKEMIDFAAENNIGGVLVEGWNTGWEHWIGFEDREGVFDFITPYSDYDLAEVVRYGKEKGVELIMHHETSAAPRTYTQQLDTAYALMQDLGIHSVKTGYVGKIIPKGEYHHGQWMVNHYHHVLETAAKYQIAINAHEPIKATGKRRTYPNAIAQEGLRGQEFNAWSPDGGNPPDHLPTVAFTRMLGGPIDFTPGIFNIKLEPYKENNQVNTTLAHQLALYVVLNSPVQMAADLIQYYEGHPAFQFIREVGVNWEQTKVLNGEVGDFVTIAREERETGNWFLGSITDENNRELDILFDFLPEGEKYEATIYADAEDAHWNKNPTTYKISKMNVNHSSEITLKLVEGGGCAISLMKK